MRDNSSKQILLSILGVAILIVAVIGVSFAAFTYAGVGKKENTITTGSITMNYTEGAKGISITNAMPVSDAVGKAITNTAGAADTGSDLAGGAGHLEAGASGVFDFNVNAKINGSVTIKYDIMVVKKSSSTLGDAYAKLYLEKSTTSATTGYSQSTAPTAYGSLPAYTTATTNAGKALTTGKVLHSDTFTTGTTHYYRLRMWVADTYTVTGTAQTFTVTVNVYGQAV